MPAGIVIFKSGKQQVRFSAFLRVPNANGFPDLSQSVTSSALSPDAYMHIALWRRYGGHKLAVFCVFLFCWIFQVAFVDAQLLPHHSKAIAGNNVSVLDSQQNTESGVIRTAFRNLYEYIRSVGPLSEMID